MTTCKIGMQHAGADMPARGVMQGSLVTLVGIASNNSDNRIRTNVTQSKNGESGSVTSSRRRTKS
jgi:hypothetical protein